MLSSDTHWSDFSSHVTAPLHGLPEMCMKRHRPNALRCCPDQMSRGDGPCVGSDLSVDSMCPCRCCTCSLVLCPEG